MALCCAVLCCVERAPRREGSDPSGRPPQADRSRDRNRPPHGTGNGEAKPFRKER